MSLREFLTAFGLERAQELALTPDTKPLTKPQLSGAPESPEVRADLWRVELEAVLPVVERLLPRVRTIRAKLGGPTLPDQEVLDWYRAERQRIVQEWNAAIYDEGWKDVPPLCDVCGMPVLRRGGEQLPSGDYELSTICGDKCRATRRKRESRS